MTTVDQQRDVDQVIESLHPLPSPRAFPALVLLIGPPASGKSSIARGLAERTPLVVLAGGHVRRLLAAADGREGEPVVIGGYSFGESHRVSRTLRAAASELLGQQRSVVIDASLLTEWERQPLYTIAALHGARLVIVEVTAPTPVILDRLRRAAGPDQAEAAVAAFHQVAGRQEPIARDHLTVDTSAPIDRFIAGLALDLDEG